MDKPIDATDRQWLDAQRTATLEQSLADMIFWMLLGQHLLGEPGDQLVPIPDGCLAEAQKLANLSAVVFDRAAGPLVTRVQICRDVDLVGDVDDDRTGYVMRLPRKASFEHERFEQDREAYVDNCRAVQNRVQQRRAVCCEIRWRCWPGCAQLDTTAAPGKGGSLEASIK